MPISTRKHMFCFGYGYSCDYLGMHLQDTGDWDISGTTRSSDKKALMTEKGIKAFLFDYDQPLADVRSFLHGVTHLLISTPPGDAGDPVFRLYADEIAKISTIEWIGYLSSTGVYGDRNGEWVDEDSRPRPSSRRGSRRALAEEQWLSLYHAQGLPVHIFRLAGIYGPGRSALDSVRTGAARRIDKPGHVFSRIHVDDIINVLVASLANPCPGRIYNVCDDNPAPSHELIAEACAMLNMPVPPLIPIEKAHLPPMAMSFYSDNKRLRNDRIKDELGVNLLHSDYKAGLQACLEAEEEDALPVLEHDAVKGRRT